jgi:hypothetical protein
VKNWFQSLLFKFNLYRYSEDHARLRGEETSLNPLGMVEGLIGAMNHAADVHGGADEAGAVQLLNSVAP